MKSSAKCCGSDSLIYLQAYFVTIATILGTGILGLPVKLSESGLYPFLVTFILDAIVQSLLVHLFVDVLQRAVAAQRHGHGNAEESVPLNSMLEEDMELESDEDEEDMPTNGAIMKGRMLHIRNSPAQVQPPNLHLLGRLFLSPGLRESFDALILLQFISILICYALAGSEAYAQILGVKHIYVIPVFVSVLTISIVFALQLIQPIVSVLTFLKGSLLLGTTVVTFYVGLAVAEEVTDNFLHIGGPFLMGTVALGGIVNTMPYTFEKVPYRKKEIQKYRLAVQMGLWTCVMLNVMWCWAVLDIVPQTVEKACGNQGALSPVSLPNMTSSVYSYVCVGELSLEAAGDNGEISTIPLTKLLERDHPHFSWVAVLVQVFIMVSITVSYLTLGSAMHHTLNGIVTTCMQKRKNSKNKSSKPPTGQWCVSTFISLLAFTLVFGVAMMNPQGFVILLEKLVSFALNVEVGLFVSVMIVISRRGKFQFLDVPVHLNKFFLYIAFLLPLFFNFAVFYDVYCSVLMLISPEEKNPGVWINGTLSSPSASLDSTLDKNLPFLEGESFVGGPSQLNNSVNVSDISDLTSNLLSNLTTSIEDLLMNGTSASPTA